MANSWLRLWHDMPTDPKWRTIAKASGQRIGDVIAVYTHLLVDASTNASERGRTHSYNCEDVASALDLETEDVAAIVGAMEGRVIDGGRLKGWRKRQVEREDGSAERAREWRERKRTRVNASDRPGTPDTDTDTDKEKEKTPPTGGGGGPSTPAGSVCKAIRARGMADVSPSNPILIELVGKGIPVETFEAAADKCLQAKPPKGFAYLLGIVKRELAEAATIASGAGMPVKAWDTDRPSIEAKGIELGLGKWNENDLSVNRETFPAYTERVRKAVNALEPA